jgi:hypothetical protein
MQKSGLSDKEGGNADSKVAEKLPRPSFWRLLALNKPEWPYLLLGTIGAIAAGLVNPFWALIVSQVRDSCRLLIGVFGSACVFVGAFAFNKLEWPYLRMEPLSVIAGAIANLFGRSSSPRHLLQSDSCHLVVVFLFERLSFRFMGRF